MSKWRADPKKGEQFVKPRQEEVVALLKQAADIAFFYIEEKLEADIEVLKKKAGEAKQKCTAQVQAAETRPTMEVVRKYWSEDPETMWKHFVHNMTKGE